MSRYEAVYCRSQADPEAFWGEVVEAVHWGQGPH